MFHVSNWLKHKEKPTDSDNNNLDELFKIIATEVFFRNSWSAAHYLFVTVESQFQTLKAG